MSCCIPQPLVVQNRFTRIQREICLGHQARLMLHGRLEQIHLFVSELLDPRPKGRGLHSTLAQAEDLEVHPEPRFFTPSSKTGLRAAERVNR